jgi:hypothetical protein
VDESHRIVAHKIPPNPFRLLRTLYGRIISSQLVSGIFECALSNTPVTREASSARTKLGHTTLMNIVRGFVITGWL